MLRFLYLIFLVFIVSCNGNEFNYKRKTSTNNSGIGILPDLILGLNKNFFGNVKSVQWDADGNYYVLSTTAGPGGFFVSKYDANGIYLSGFGVSGMGATELAFPWDLAIDSDGNILVSDSGSNRIQKYTPGGLHIMSFGDAGLPAENLSNPRGIDFDSSGNTLFIADAAHKIKIFTKNGVYVNEFGASGSNDGEFTTPNDVHVDAAGNIFVVDGLKIQKFNAAFGHLMSIVDGSMESITTDAAGNIYTYDFTPSLRKYDASGTFLTVIGSSGTGYDQYENWGGSLEITPDGRLALAERSGSKILIYTLAGVLNERLNSMGDQGGEFRTPYRSVTDANGNIYVSSTQNHQIQKFDKNGNHLLSFGSYGVADNEFNQTGGVAIDTDGSIFVVDVGNRVVKKFLPNGTFDLKFGATGAGPGQFTLPLSIRLTSTHVYVADVANNCIQKWTKAGVFVSQFGTPGVADGELTSPYDFIFDSEGNILVVEAGNNRIQKFDPDGVHLDKFGIAGAADGEFMMPVSLALDSEGNIFVLDYLRKDVQKFDKEGVFLSKQSSFVGYTLSPAALGLYIDSGDNMYVTDSLYHRVFRTPAF